MSTTTLTTPERTELLSRVALGVAGFATLLAPVHALARFATEDGKSDLELPGVSAWAEPARDALEPILDWASADTVYVSYGKLFLFVMAFTTMAAIAVRTGRGETQGAEKWGWRIAIPGYLVLTAACFGEYWLPFVDEAFALLAIPGLLISMIGSTVLGIALLRRGFRPRTSAVLLTAFIPLVFALSSIIALGAALLPLVWAFALAVRAQAQRS